MPCAGIARTVKRYHPYDERDTTDSRLPYLHPEQRLSAKACGSLQTVQVQRPLSGLCGILPQHSCRDNRRNTIGH